MTQPNPLDRLAVYREINAGITTGLPAPKGIVLYDTSAHIDLDSVADLTEWQAWFGMRDESVHGQPFPSPWDPADMKIWSSSVWMRWEGWHLSLKALDPITDEWRDGWFASGQDVAHRPKPTEPKGLDYSREPDSTPASPAREPLHTGAVVDGGALVDETEPTVPVLTPAGLTVDADQLRGPLAGTTPVVTYFTVGYDYVTVVAPTYDSCREAMFAKYGARWGFSYIAGMRRATEVVSGRLEREVIVAPGVDPALAEVALKSASDLLAAEPVSEAR